MTAPSAAPDRASFFASLRLIFGPLTAAKVRSVDRAIDALLGVAPETTPMLMPIDAAGLKLIERFEGIHDGDRNTPVLEPQMDPIGIWTLGYGYALFVDGKALKGAANKAKAYAIWREMFPAGMTLEDARWLVLKVIGEWSGRLEALLERPLNQSQSNALISLAYNIGIGIKDGRKGDLADSALIAAINAGQMSKAADHFRDWVFAGGKKLPGLVTRRAAERAMFLEAK